MKKPEMPAISGNKKGYTNANLLPNKFTGFQQESLLVEPNFSGIKKLEIEINKDFDAVVGFAFYRIGSVEWINSYLSITSDDGVLISNVNSSVFASTAEDMEKNKIFFPLFVRNTSKGRKVSFSIDIKRSSINYSRYFVVLMLKNKVLPYPYEFDVFSHKKTLTTCNASLDIPYQEAFATESMPSNFDECIGLAVCPQIVSTTDLKVPIKTAIGLRDGFLDLLSFIPTSFLYLRGFAEIPPASRFFPIYIDKVNNKVLDIQFKTFENINDSYKNRNVEFLFLLRRKSQRTNVR